MTWPNETNGIPNGLNVNFGGPLGAILPSAICGDLGPCNPIGMGATANVGVSVNGTLPIGLSFTLFAGLVCDSHWRCRPYWGRGYGAGVGAGVSGGVQVSGSNGNTVCAFGGPFYNYSGTFGEVAAGTADYYEGAGDAPGGVVRGGGLSFGVGGGGSASAYRTTTNVSGCH